MTGRIVASVVLLAGCACLASHCSSANAQEKGAAPATSRVTPPEVEAWVKEVAAKMTDSNEIVRRSAVHALLAVGPDALPSLGKLAGSDDQKVAATAMDVIAAIKHGGGPGGPGGRPGMQGPGPRMGPGPDGPDGPPCPRCSGMGPTGMQDGPGRPRGGPGGPMGPEGMHHGMQDGMPGGPNGRHGGPDGMHGGPGRALEELGLDADKRGKVEEVLRGLHEKVRALHEKAMQGQRDAMHAEHEKLRLETEEALKALLTPEQLKKLTDAMGPRGPRLEQVPGQGPGAK